MQTDLNNKAHLSIMKINQFFSASGLFIAPVFIWLKINRIASSSFVNLHFELHKNFLLTLLIWICLIPLVNASYWLNKQIHFPDFLLPVEVFLRDYELKAEVIIQAFLSDKSILAFIGNIIIMAILPALGEELFFRVFIQRFIISKTGKIFLSIALTAFLFSILHMQFSGILPRFVLGFALGLIYVKTQNIWYPLVFHLLNNSIAIIATTYFSKEHTTLEQFGITSSTVILLLPILWALYYLFRQFTNEELEKIP